MRPTAIVVRLIRFCPRYVSICLAFSLVALLVVPITLGLATQAFFDAVTHGPAGLNAWSAIAVIVGAQVTEAIAGPVFAAPWSPMQQKSHVLLRRNLFAGILAGYGPNGLPVSAGEAISRFRDDPEIIADALDALCDLIGRASFAVVAAILMWRIDSVITVVLFVPLLLCSILTDRLRQQIMRYRSAARTASGVVSGFLGDLLGAQLALKIAGATPHAVARLNDLSDVRRRMEIRDSVFASILTAIGTNLGSLGTGVVLLLGAGAMRTGRFTVGDLALFAVFLDALSLLPEEISRLIGGLSRIEVSFARMLALVPGTPPADLVLSAPIYLDHSQPPPTETRSREPLNRLDVRGLTYAYPDSDRGISDVSFTLERGTLTVVTGRIGSGKSTLLAVLLGLLPRDDGAILWNGIPVDDPSTFFVPPLCAYTAQAPRLFSETLRENILLGWPAGEETLRGAVHAAVLESDVVGLEDGLDTLIGPRGVKLSGGQVQRAAAARMFVRESELLVFDDLSSALDAETDAQLWDRLFERSPRPTCLVVSHRPAVLRHADQVLVLDGGRIVPSSSPRA